MQGLKIERLELKDISQAFPLIQLQHKGLTIAQWTEFAQRIIDTNGGSQRGLLAARNDHVSLEEAEPEPAADLVVAAAESREARGHLVRGLGHAHSRHTEERLQPRAVVGRKDAHGAGAAGSA